MNERMRVMRAAMFTPSVRNGNHTQWGLPLLFWGLPGVAKTSVARQVADLCKAPYFVFSPGEQGEGGIGQVPVPAADGYLDCPAPRWSKPFTEKDGYGVVILDELTTADTRLQPGMLALALERSIGGKTLGGRARVLAFANPVEVTPGGTDLAPPLANRFIHIEWAPPSVEEFLSYMATSEASEVRPDGFDAITDPAAEERRVLAAWSSAYADSVGIVAGFLHASPGNLHRMPSPDEAAHGKAWCSPRSWDMAIRAYTAAKIHGLTPEERITLIAGAVGAGVAREFTNYAKTMDLPPAMDVLLGKVQWNIENERLDRSFAVMRAITTLACSLPKEKESSSAAIVGFWRIMERSIKVRPDLALNPVITALKALIHAVTQRPEYWAAAATTVDAIGKSGVRIS